MAAGLTADQRAWVAPFTAALDPLAHAARAVPMRAYMKDKFAYLGVAAPARKVAQKAPIAALAKADAKTLLAVADALFSLEEREYHYAAIDLLTRYERKLDTSHLPALLTLAQRNSWWDSVDALAHIIGRVLHKAHKAGQNVVTMVDALLVHSDMWLRRIAMLHQNEWKADTDAERLFRYANALGAETDFFIRKAIGWALRDFAKHNPDAVRAYLEGEGAGLSGLSRREGGKHLGLK